MVYEEFVVHDDKFTSYRQSQIGRTSQICRPTRRVIITRSSSQVLQPFLSAPSAESSIAADGGQGVSNGNGRTLVLKVRKRTIWYV